MRRDISPPQRPELLLSLHSLNSPISAPSSYSIIMHKKTLKSSGSSWPEPAFQLPVCSLNVHTLRFILSFMSSVRKTISFPPAVARHLDREAKRQGKSVSSLVTELVSRQPAALPYAGLIDDDEDLSLRVEEILGRLER